MDTRERKAWFSRNDDHDTPILNEYMENFEKWDKLLERLKDIGKIVLAVIILAIALTFLIFVIGSIIETASI